MRPLHLPEGRALLVLFLVLQAGLWLSTLRPTPTRIPELLSWPATREAMEPTGLQADWATLRRGIDERLALEDPGPLSPALQHIKAALPSLPSAGHATLIPLGFAMAFAELTPEERRILVRHHVRSVRALENPGEPRGEPADDSAGEPPP